MRLTQGDFKVPQFIAILSLLLLWNFVSVKAFAAERPPQFVMMAFDNCQENETWKGVDQFLTEMNSVDQNRLRFTFFVSGVGFLTDSARTQYVDPLLRRGKSNINFGGSKQDILQRISFMNKVFNEGNEIASHAVGHFDGSKWTSAQWHHEFSQFVNILRNLADLNGFLGADRDQARLAFSPFDISGFRAPYLGGSKDLIRVIQDVGYDYDTSDVDANYDAPKWPSRYVVDGKPGPWSFGLSWVKPQNLPQQIPAMDYNFCFRQAGGCPEKYPDTLRGAEKDGANMLAAYQDLFLKSYNGNRAPLNIGHHFQQYRGGVYDRVLLKFARQVCSLPEVRCTNYKQLVTFMNEMSEDERRAYQAGSFVRRAVLNRSELLP
jgi:peptidoglycan/xylan/chitin deacetylase (PgdA/CDA1 family)